jgi:hypothetical protein
MNRRLGLVWAASLGCMALFRASPVSAQLAEVAGLRAGAPLSLGRLQLDANVIVDRIASPIGPRTAYTADAALRLPMRSSGVWLGSALEAAREIDTLPVRPLLRGGVWHAFRATRVSIEAGSHVARVGGRAARHWTETRRDSLVTDSGVVFIERPLTFGDSGSASKTTFWSDVQARLAWIRAGSSLEVVVGARPRVAGFQSSMWGHLRGTYDVTSHLSLVGAVGTQTTHIGLGIPSTRFAAAAIRVSPWRSHTAKPRPSAFVVTAVGSRGYRVTFVAPEATSVELSGDFGEWKPVSLTQAKAGVWETTLSLSPGTYHVNLRINGGQWTAPPGLPQAHDDFNGTVGVLVVR